MVWFKKSKVFDNLVELSLIVKEASRVFQNILDDWGQLEKGWKTLEYLENKADDLVHIITDEIERVFILPLDKDDIKSLTESLDDVMDNIEQIANRLYIYRIKEGNEPLKEFSKLLVQAIENIHQGILMVRDRKITSKEFAETMKMLHFLENEADKVHRVVLEEMMNCSSSFAGNDPILIIKWKEIFQTLEDTMDRCEDFAVIFSKIRIKYR